MTDTHDKRLKEALAAHREVVKHSEKLDQLKKERTAALRRLEQAGGTLQEVAERIGMTRSAVSLMKQGKR